MSTASSGQPAVEQNVATNAGTNFRSVSPRNRWANFSLLNANENCSMGTFTVPHPPGTAMDQQQSQAPTSASPAPLTTPIEKKNKSGKKSKAAALVTQQMYSQSNNDSTGEYFYI